MKAGDIFQKTPGGMYQADDLRQEVLQMIHDEEIFGLR
jgi:hypothetical protein